MNQHDLNRRLAQVTGESVATIEALGFSLLIPSPPPPPERKFRYFRRLLGGKGRRRAHHHPARATHLLPKVIRIPSTRGGA